MASVLILLFPLLPTVLSQSVVSCAPSFPFPRISCVNNYAAVLPGNFSRQVINVVGASDTFASTSVPDDPSFASLSSADFVVFDRSSISTILGANPTLEFMFTIPEAAHEAPVYIPATNELWFSELAQDQTSQFVIENVNSDTPTLTRKTSNPPVYAPGGGTLHNGSVYWCQSGGGEVDGRIFRPGVVRFDRQANHSEVLLNNYFGYYFDTCDDIVVDSKGDVWFTDNFYSRPDETNDQAPQLETATYRFRPSTGAVQIVDDSLDEPNGIAFSPDQKTLYLTDTGAGSVIIDPSIPSGPIRLNSTGKRTVYAFDVSEDGNSIGNKRAIYLSQDYAADGIKVAENGYLALATGFGADIVTPQGTLLVRVQTNYTVVNLAWAGTNLDELWLVGVGGVSRVKWALKGLPLV